MCKVYEFKGKGASFASRLTPAARLHYKAGANICHRIEHQYVVQLRYAIEEWNEIDREVRNRWIDACNMLTEKQFTKVKGDTIFQKARSALKVTKSDRITHKLWSIIWDESTYHARKQWLDECRETSRKRRSV